MALKNNEIIKEQSKYFDFYLKLPKILAIINAVLFFIWAIVDPAAIQHSGGSRWGYYYHYYGILRFDTAFGCCFFWIFIGAIFTAVTYIFMKIAFSHKILQIEYLKEISASLDKNAEVAKAENADDN